MKLLIIGGGAAGLACALSASHTCAGAEITVLERQSRIGKKLLVTGNGRCNLGNSEIRPDCYLTSSPDTLTRMLAGMPPELLRGFWERLGLRCMTETDSGRIYPASNQAASVLDTLLLALNRQKIQVVCDARAAEIRRKKNGFSVQTEDGRTFFGDRLVLAAGGSAAPEYGTDGAAFALCRAAGHRVLPVYPCLTPLKCSMDNPGGLKGIRVRGTAGVYRGETKLGQREGELQLTEYGLSGIPAMELACLLKGREQGCTAVLDLLPEYSPGRVGALLKNRVKKWPEEPVDNLLTGLVQRRLSSALLKNAGISPLSRPCGELSVKELDRLAKTLKGWRFPVTGTMGWARAQTTGGGVPLDEVDPDTLESRTCPGLYLAGELLDAAGFCGGYNLHWAFCTGILAGRNAVR